MTDSDDPTPTDPAASRPEMPGYGLLPATEGRGLLPWSWAVARLSGARVYWLATTRPDGRPHAMPVWGIWQDDTFYFSTGADSRKARNLAANRHCVVSVEHRDDAVVVEGVSAPVTQPEIRARFMAGYGAKYTWPMEEFAETVYAVRPTVVFAFLAAPGEFGGSATRWVFAAG